MSYGLVGLYAIYLIFVGIHGNSSKLFKYIEQDGKGFAPWLLAIIILRGLYSVDSLKPIVKPFMGLAVLTFVLRNFNQVLSQIDNVTGLKIGEDKK